jgi:uncharacterized protein (TIGR03435 family)
LAGGVNVQRAAAPGPAAGQSDAERTTGEGRILRENEREQIKTRLLLRFCLKILGRPGNTVNALVCGSGFAGIFLLASALTAAQAAPTLEPSNPELKIPAYEVASIHENTNPNPRWNIYFTPDGVHAMDVTLLSALGEAYGIGDDELWSGGPEWIYQKRFDIEAKYDVAQFPNLSRQQRMAMLQQLLADRFKVVVHHESKEFLLYALVPAKDGAKITETKPEELKRSPEYGVMCAFKRAGKGLMEMSGCRMTQFAQSLSGYGRSDLGRRVVDQTGLTGYYTIDLHWTPVDLNAPAPAADSILPDASGPSLLTALKEQLGLELKPTKGPIDTIVIDHAELPTEN